MSRPTSVVLTASLIAFSLSRAVEPAHAYPASHLWSKKFGSDQSNENADHLATDPSGNVILGAHVSSSADFGGGLVTTAGFTDGVMAKYDPNGNHLWSRRMGGSTGYDFINGVAVDGSGNIYVLGYFANSVDFGLGALTSAGNFDIYVGKFASSNGAVIWNKRFGSTGSDQGHSIAVDASGNVFITGDFSGTVSFGGSSLVSSGTTDIFLVKLDTAGNHVVSSRYGTASGEGCEAIACDPFGNVIVTGWFLGTMSFGGSSLVAAGSTDIVLAKYDNNLVHVWSKRFGNTTAERGNSVATTWSGDIYLAGNFTNSVDFGGGPLAGGVNDDIVLAKYDTNGTHQWSQRFGGLGYDRAIDVAVDFIGRPFVTGYFDGVADFGGGPFISAGADAFVAHFETTGAHRWSGSYGGSSGDGGQTIATDIYGDVIVGGYFYNTINFGGGNLTATPPFPPDLFLVKFSGPPANPLIMSIDDIPNDQGRQVKIRFEKSARDGVVAAPVTEYEAYRADAPGPSMVAPDPAGLSRDQLLADGWTFVGAVPAHGEPNYGIDAPTIGDSTITLGLYNSFFYIRAATASATVFYDSPPVMGYSLDNLAPGAPSNFVYSAGDLSWNKSTAEDFDYFTVYGSNTDAFGSATVVDYSVVPELDVNASPYVFYFVTATDFSGNEGKPAKVNTLSGVGGSPKNYVLSLSNYPNPFNPRTTVKYTAPSPGEVKVRIYDARGALVKTLFEGYRAEGAYTVAWDGRTDNAAVAASGVYFARIEHASGTRSKKMVLLK